MTSATSRPAPVADDRSNNHVTRRPPTIVDVARAAGVSHSTVSRVLNGRPNISAETRRRVEDALARLGYVADTRARSLAGGRLGCVGLVVFDLGSSYLNQIVRSVDQALADEGLDLLLCTTHRRELREHTYVQRLANGAVDGLIVVIPTEAERYAATLAERHVPCVLVDHGQSVHASNVISDNARGMWMIIDHLHAAGHRRIGAIAGRAGRAATTERIEAHRQAVSALGLDTDPALVVPGDYLEPGAYEAAQTLLDLSDPPTAIVAPSDEAAMAVLRAARKRGLDVPADLSITGFDDIPEAALMSPGLTTVRQAFDEMGSQAVQLLLERLEDPDRLPVQLRLPVELIVRDSTGAPRRT
ncbi:MAG: LacI family DNA-binding transcriptional regulator [Acidimicrobiales bacterium]